MGTDWTKRFVLSPTNAAELRAQQHLIDQQRLIVNALEGALYRSVEEKFGINLKDENWTLNVDEGTLEYAPDADTTTEG